MIRVTCSTRPCPTVAKAKVFKAATSIFAPPGVDLLCACATHITDNIKVARKSRNFLLHPRLVSQSAFFYMVEAAVNLTIPRVDELNSCVASGVIEGVLTIVKLSLLLL